MKSFADITRTLAAHPVAVPMSVFSLVGTAHLLAESLGVDFLGRPSSSGEFLLASLGVSVTIVVFWMQSNNRLSLQTSNQSAVVRIDGLFRKVLLTACSGTLISLTGDLISRGQRIVSIAEFSLAVTVAVQVAGIAIDSLGDFKELKKKAAGRG